MARILGAHGEGAEGLIDRMLKGIPRGQGASGRSSRAAKGDFAMCLVPNAGSFESGLFIPEDGTSYVAYDGFMPGVREVLAGEGSVDGAPLGAGFLAMYRRLGPEFLRRIPGMFAIALYDAVAKRLLVCGDRNGLFPMYIAERPHAFVFGSTIGAVRAGAGSTAIDTAGVFEYLFFDTTWGGATCYSGIRVLPYGTYVSYDAERRTAAEGSYFRYEDLFDLREFERNRAIDAPRELTAHLKSCCGRVIKDGDPAAFGLLCGGGIDCSYVGGVLNDIGFRIPYYCSNVAGGPEEEMAKSSAAHLGNPVVIGRLTPERYYPLLLSSITDFGQPIGHPNLAKFYTIMAVAGSHERRSQIMGVASDLLFGSIDNVRTYYRTLKMRTLVRFLSPSMRRRLSMIFARPDVVRYELRMRNPWYAVAGLGGVNFERGSIQERASKALAGIPNENERNIKTLMLMNLCDYKQHLLNRRFEIGAIYGVSLYFPFLDSEMVAFALNLPLKHSVRWHITKRVIRKAARPYLGPTLSLRKKFGGAISLEDWIVPLAFLLEGGFLADTLHFNAGDLRRIADRHPKLLWNLVDIELWGRMCVWGVEAERILDELRSRGIAIASEGPPSDTA